MPGMRRIDMREVIRGNKNILKILEKESDDADYNNIKNY